MPLYEFNKLGDFNQPAKQIKLSEDIKQFLVSPVMRNGYGLDINNLDYNNDKTMQEAYTKLRAFINGLKGVESCKCQVKKTVNPNNDEGGYVYILYVEISYEISANEYKTLNLDIDLIA